MPVLASSKIALFYSLLLSGKCASIGGVFFLPFVRDQMDLRISTRVRNSCLFEFKKLISEWCSRGCIEGPARKGVSAFFTSVLYLSLHAPASRPKVMTRRDGEVRFLIRALGPNPVLVNFLHPDRT